MPMNLNYHNFTPFRTPFFLPMLYPQLIWRMNEMEKAIYLTFDDGPISGPTEFVLEELSKRNVLATFFCIGDNIQKHTPIFQNILASGHRVGNHTFNHLKGWETTTSEYEMNVKLCERQIESNNSTKTHSLLFRPPFGRITRKQVATLSNYKIIMWDVLTHDYSNDILPEVCLKRSLSATRHGSIVVFHDSIRAEKRLIYVLPRFLDDCLSKGYAFKIFK